MWLGAIDAASSCGWNPRCLFGIRGLLPALSPFCAESIVLISISGPESGVERHALVDVEVAREADFGENDETFHVVTHLGNLLQVGDVVLGYDLVASVLSSEAEWALEHNATNASFVMHDIVLVKKIHIKNNNNNNKGNIHN
eukprot:scaffold122895_cov74-Attheya_sp.AAC.1